MPRQYQYLEPFSIQYGSYGELSLDCLPVQCWLHWSVGTYKNSPGKCKAMVICTLPRPCLRCTEDCPDKFDATPENECILQEIKRVPPVQKILQPPRQRILTLMHASATPVTWTHPDTPYAHRQNPVNQVFFALLGTEEGRACACRVGLFQRWLGLDVVQLSVPFSTGSMANLGLEKGSFRK